MVSLTRTHNFPPQSFTVALLVFLYLILPNAIARQRPPPAANTAQIASISAPALRQQLVSYNMMLASFEEALFAAGMSKAEEAEEKQHVAQLVSLEDSILGQMREASPADQATALSIIANARLALQHRNPVPAVEAAIIANATDAPLLALDIGQLGTARALVEKRQNSASRAMRDKIDFAGRLIQADTPPHQCGKAPDALCESLYALLAPPSSRMGRLQDLQSQLKGKRPQRAEILAQSSRVQRQVPISQAVLPEPGTNLPLPASMHIKVQAWQAMQISPKTAVELDALWARGPDNDRSYGREWVDIALNTPSLKRLLGNDVALHNGAEKPAADAGAKAASVILQDKFAVGTRRFLTIKVDVGRSGRILVAELPAPGDQQLRYWLAELVNGGITYRGRGPTSIADGALIVTKTEGSSGYLSVWLVDPVRRRTTRIFNEEEAYHGRFFTADMDGTGEHKLWLTRATGNHRYEDCNQCPSRVQSLLFQYQPHTGQLRLLADYVSWGDLGTSTNRNLVGLGPEVGRYGLSADIEEHLTKLATLDQHDGESIQEETTVLAEQIQSLLETEAIDEAAVFAQRALSLLKIKTAPYAGRADLDAWLAYTAGRAYLAQGNLRAAKEISSIDARLLADTETRNGMLHLQLQVARTTGTLDDYYDHLRMLLEQQPENLDVQSRLVDYLLLVGNFDAALRVARATSDHRTSLGQDWSIGLYEQALALTQLGRYNSAVATLSMLLRESMLERTSTLNAKAWLLAAEIALRTEHFDAATHLLDAGLAQLDSVAWSEQGPVALLLYGRMLHATNKNQRALAVLQAASKLVNRQGPLWPGLQDQTAMVLQSLKQPAAAAAASEGAFTSILNLQITVAEETNKLAFVGFNADIAERHLSRLLTSPPVDPIQVSDALEAWRAQVLREVRQGHVGKADSGLSPSKTIAAFARGTVAYISYYLDQERPVAVVAERGQFRVVPLKLTRRYAEQARLLVQRHMDWAQPVAHESILLDEPAVELLDTLATLHHMLIADLRLQQDIDTLVIVPDERLYWLPWPAIAEPINTTSGSERSASLFERYTVLLTPSALLLVPAPQAAQTASASYLGLATLDTISADIIKKALPDVYRDRQPADLPGLRSAVQELDDMARILDPHMTGKQLLLQGADTPLSDLVNKMQAASIIHIAAHGIFNPNDPMRSAIFLSPSAEQGVLRPGDLAALDLSKVSLVSLSACQTGASEVLRGGEAIGFVRGLLVGGAHRILLANWSVKSQPTQQFFHDFYTGLITESDSAAAYRSAVLSASKRYRHPFYWSAFAMYSNTLH